MMKILVAGIGNIFMGDDGFGCEVAGRLSQRKVPAGVDVVDFGIRGLDLGYALMDGYEVVILIDTVDRGEAPGTLYLIEPEIGDAAAPARGEQLMAPHGMDPASVLRFIAALDQRRPRVLMVCCQPAFLGGEQGHMGLSEEVTQSVDKALTEVLGLVDELLA
ncbi:hydrogenase maturation protease [Pseudomonas fluorescens]|uniref:Hydrogenase 2 maturation protease n=1 Tax=Pseudomonas fluorescens TaxID=294 RepID=A0A5E7AWH4_PSEFL|nr:hydrogenase maturation protease [Pseudomonas fluorescens]VVN81044.1 Hydrogenase 2 maturation protease [Pseudomonas fluorescens]